MAIGNAIRLIKDVKTNERLRDMLNSFSDTDLELFLHRSGYRFTYSEFEDAITGLHLACQTVEEANLHMEIATWLTYLLTIYK